MWIPESVSEIAEAIEIGYLSETATFDAKSDLPPKGKSKDLAIDVAAMANDGGTLLYGVGEDENQQLTIPTPIDLAGAAERADQIVRTCISEPPEVQIRSFHTEDAPAVGYLVVAVPPSPRAPHMVIVGKDHRYYGRSATGNVRLTEGEVARLYDRRRRWEVDRDELLNEAISRAPLAPDEDYAYLHLVARPVVADEDLLDRAKGEQNPVNFLNELFRAALHPGLFPRSYSPDLAEGNTFQRGADGWRASRGLDENGTPEINSGRVLLMEIGLDGSARLFCGRAADRRVDRFLIIEDLVAGLTTRFMSILGALHAAGSYLGPVDAGISVTGLGGGVSAALRDYLDLRHSLLPYDRDEYRRTERFSTLRLKDDPQSAASALVTPLVRATTQERYDPFAK